MRADQNSLHACQRGPGRQPCFYPPFFQKSAIFAMYVYFQSMFRIQNFQYSECVISEYMLFSVNSQNMRILASARIQPKSARASSQISEFRSCMHSVSWIHARAGGWAAAHAMVWARLPGRATTSIDLRNLLSANSSARTS